MRGVFFIKAFFDSGFAKTASEVGAHAVRVSREIADLPFADARRESTIHPNSSKFEGSKFKV
jgi:hypothetical protein